MSIVATLVTWKIKSQSPDITFSLVEQSSPGIANINV